MRIEEAMNVIQKDSADNLRLMLALNTIFDAIRNGDYVLIRKQEVYSLEARFQRLKNLMMFRERMTNEDIRDCENCKHYILHDKTVNLPPIYACEEWECEFEPKEEQNDE